MGCDFCNSISSTRIGIISIHAPIVGCDLHEFVSKICIIDFNPRTHRGVRRCMLQTPCHDFLYFNPRTHRGVRHETKKSLQYICIHFNPRTHRGVRPDFELSTVPSLLFQSTHPSWGATKSLNAFKICVMRREFQSTHPSWGATCLQKMRIN